MTPVRIAIISDTHCGHVVGLTHPDFDARPNDTKSPQYTLYTHRRKLWDWFTCEVKSQLPVDILVVNGDAIDGKGDKSGGVELLTTDRNEQVDAASAIIEQFGAKELYGTMGTPYHAGQLESWERQIFAKHNGVFDDRIFLDVRGAVFDIRHFVIRSSIPHGRYTPLAKEKMWNVLQAEHGTHPIADITVRSHVHYFAVCGGSSWLAFITPALQYRGTKYGNGKMSGIVDFGFLVFDVYSKDRIEWRKVIFPEKKLPVRALKSKL